MKRSKQRILGGLAVTVASLAVAAPSATADPTVASLPVGTAAADGHTVRVTPTGAIETVTRSEATRSLPVGTAVSDGNAVRTTAAGMIETVTDEAARSLPVGTAVTDGDAVRVTAAGTIETLVKPYGAVPALPVGTAVADGNAVRVGPEGTIETLSRSAPATIVVAPGGMDWVDAGIGAGMAFGLILLIGSCVLLFSRRHRQPTVPAH